MSALWRAKHPLVLASSSRTRRDLLTNAGFVVETVAPEVDERAIENDARAISPIELARRLAVAKARAVATHMPDRIVIGADQVLECDGIVFHKPTDAKAACLQLGALQGKTHALHSAVAIVREDALETFCETARLTMRSLDTQAIAAYVAQVGETRVTSSVGGYQLEGLGIHLFERIEGEHSTILGLPLLPLLARLRGMGLLAF